MAAAKKTKAPLTFEACLRKKGAKIRTETISKNRYRRTCEVDGILTKSEILTKK